MMDFTGNYIVFRLYEKLEWEMGRKGEEESCNDKFRSPGRTYPTIAGAEVGFN
jgi:hypothetical protein